MQYKPGILTGLIQFSDWTSIFVSYICLHTHAILFFYVGIQTNLFLWKDQKVPLH